MTVWVALFRGINVGGKNILPMRGLREILAELGCKDVITYIQSGNAVFASSFAADRLTADIRVSIDAKYGFAPQVMVLSVDDFKAAALANPFPEAEATPRLLHVSFLAEAPRDPDLGGLDDIRCPTESFELKGAAFYLHAPDGIGRSKLAQMVEKKLGVGATARNWRTVSKLLELAENIS